MTIELLSVECPEPVEGQAFVYILICENNAFYVGMSEDVASRLDVHKRGQGAKHTRVQSPFRLVYVEGPIPREVAAKRERQIKKWSRSKKVALIRNDPDLLKLLAKSRD